MFYFCFKLWSFKALVVISFNFQVSKKKKKKNYLNGFANLILKYKKKKKKKGPEWLRHCNDAEPFGS